MSDLRLQKERLVLELYGPKMMDLAGRGKNTPKKMNEKSALKGTSEQFSSPFDAFWKLP